jgi:hypothetical protein
MSLLNSLKLLKMQNQVLKGNHECHYVVALIVIVPALSLFRF